MNAVATWRGRFLGRSKGVRDLLGRPWVLAIVLATGLNLVYLLGVFANWGDVANRSLLANLGMLPIGLAATSPAWSAAQVQIARRSRWAWRFVCVGFACFFAQSFEQIRRYVAVRRYVAGSLIVQFNAARGSVDVFYVDREGRKSAKVTRVPIG